VRRTGWTAVLLVDLTVALAWLEGNTPATTASVYCFHQRMIVRLLCLAGLAPRRAASQVRMRLWRVGDWRGPAMRPVSSPRPSNRACGSPAPGLPTFFTGGIRPARASPGRAWAE